MIGKDEFAEAARALDSISEEHTAGDGEGFEVAVAGLGVDADGIAYVAKQRALRAIITITRSDKSFDFTKMQTVTLTAQEERMQTLLAAVWIDGASVGVRAAKKACQ